MYNPLDLQGKVAVISGGAGGIGLATGKLMAECGARVVLLDNNLEKGNAAVKRAEGCRAGCDVSPMRCDQQSGMQRHHHVGG